MACRKFFPIHFILGLTLGMLPAWSQQTTATNAPASVAPTVAPANNSAEAYVKFGTANGQNGDFDAAVAAFNEAIKIDPKYAPAYQGRGYAFYLLKQSDLALDSYNQAIQLDPQYAEAYYTRGVIEGERGIFPAAMTDFDKAIQLDSNFARAYYNRGHTKYFMGDLKGALDDTSHSIALEPGYSYSYFIRGLARHAAGDREGAVSDFQRSADSGYAYGTFWLWIVRMEGGERGPAREVLLTFVKKADPAKANDWVYQIANFLLEKIPQDQLIADAKGGATEAAHLGEGWFYIGMAKHFSGDNKGAITSFQNAVATGAKDSEEYIEAQRQIAKLQGQ